MAAWKEYSAPASEPLTLDEVKLQCAVDRGDVYWDTLLTGLIPTARKKAERFTRRSFIATGWDYYLDEWPDVIWLPRAPVTAITNVYYYDTTGAELIHPSTEMVFDLASEPARISRAFARIWPPIPLQPINGIRVRFTAGAATADEDDKAAMKLIVDWLFNHRGGPETGDEDMMRACGAYPILFDRRVWTRESR